MFNNYRLNFKFFIYIVLFSLFLPFFYNLLMNRILRTTNNSADRDVSGHVRFNDDHPDMADGGDAEKLDPHDQYHKSVKKELRSDKYLHDFYDFHDENGLGGDMDNFHHTMPEDHYGLKDSDGRMSNFLSEDNEDDKVLTAAQLSDYNGEEGSKGLYIALLGDVYDVKSGANHYGPGGGYNFFAGRDATNSFITGEFNKVTDDMDDVLTHLTPRDILSLFQWKEFYDSHNDYKYKGKVIGRFYNANGQQTEYYAKVLAAKQQAIDERDNEKRLESLHPPCNIEWKAETGTRVWCTKMSGGIQRDWAGVPRKYYQTAEHNFRCACIKEDQVGSPNLKEYDNCAPDSDVCYYKAD